MTRIEKQLLDHEGYSGKVYRCPANKLTIGIGRNLEDKGITQEEALYLLRNDIHECTVDLIKIFPNWSSLAEDRRLALIDMRFNLGPVKFRGFKKMIQAIHDKKFDLAAYKMKNSRWYKQVGRRGKNLANMMRRDFEDK